MTNRPDPFTPPDPDRERAHREYAGLFRINERHAATETQRHRHFHPTVLDPHEAVRLVAVLAAGSAKLDRDEDEIDTADLTAALTLIPKMRSDMDALEASLLLMARGRGLTWQDIAFGLGLGSAQAARQRYERLASRAESTPS